MHAKEAWETEAADETSTLRVESEKESSDSSVVEPMVDHPTEASEVQCVECAVCEAREAKAWEDLVRDPHPDASLTIIITTIVTTTVVTMTTTTKL